MHAKKWGEFSMSMFGSKAFTAPLAALALMAGSSVALAANNGVLPGQGKPDTVVVGEPTDLPTPAAKPTEIETPEPTETPTTAPDDDADTTGVNSSLFGKCTAYFAGGYANSTKNGNVNPSWRDLEDAAGGADNLNSFCAQVVADKEAARSTSTVDDDDDADEPKPAKPAKPERAHHATKPEKPAKPEHADHADHGKKH
jgi:hypothetical protein